MTTKKSSKKINPRNLVGFLGLSNIGRRPFLVASATFLVIAAVISSGFGNRNRISTDLREFEVGRAAPRDVISERAFSYVDRDATEQKRNAAARESPAVFKYDPEISRDVLASYERFSELCSGLFLERVTSNQFRAAIQEEYPDAFPPEILDMLLRDPVRERILENGMAVLREVLAAGVFALPRRGLELYNTKAAELLTISASGVERKLIEYSNMIRKGKTSGFILKIIEAGSFPSSFEKIAPELLEPFITENVFFSAEDTKARLDEAVAMIKPEILKIQQGERIIREGYIVTVVDMNKLQAISASVSHGNAGIVAGHLLSLSLVFFIFVFLTSQRMTTHEINPREVYFLSILTALYILGSHLLRTFLPLADRFPIALFMPTALAVMLPAILMSYRYGAVFALILPFGAFVSGAFSVQSFIFAVISGISAVFAIREANRRMDLVKAGFVVAAFNTVSILALFLLGYMPNTPYLIAVLLSVINGIVSGMLFMGCLSLVEQALNTATPFRLIELSDLNSPILKRLLTMAPGTYSHSIMVANLAETACQDIGANSLLARVASYYHDIGKMDQSDYFIENQTAYNKHDDLAPRLSATVIRSHVKIGVEKARSMKLPKEIIDIIGEHHGDSVITYFYNEALKREAHVNVEDFTYPGKPPRSRESAVVMLADVVEAAVRTLKKPSAARLEKFIQELIFAKFEHGQLSSSELTFRDLETIKTAFVRVLAGHYHSRIEYPKPFETAHTNMDAVSEGIAASNSAAASSAAASSAASSHAENPIISEVPE